ncbi:rab3 GTPase-activating protein non-catalytic subunit-like isoform X1 [Mizuhopecten yessoensis]|uniref:rab3 GTPase-activating protein non-catalytic subunit-like isoform X1 n=1 Tax=Mizuhopecten yessoensis TaxID=6573 RepID=UPI000B457277|nr:rab3 GTPase-activating protein non-catalytic subunit-like isoform X1 [Mizuhopecten yessoensis]
MSCQLTSLAHFSDISKVKKYLFPNLKEDSPERLLKNAVTEGGGWDVEWDDWNEEEDSESASTPMEEEATSDSTMADTKHGWLQDCVISLSPANDMIAIANEQKIVLLSQKYDPQNKEADIDTKLTKVWEGTMHQEEGETITAILCLPLASQKRSTQGGPDWTCVIVGFSSGHLRMYTESGTLLLSQLLHTEPVQKLKCHTYEPPRYLGLAEQHEELVILFKRALVTIDGFSLFQSLRACRNQVARATASGTDSALLPPPLAYKKWGLQGQERILDCWSCGVGTPNPFDQMKAAAILGGPSATIRPTPPAHSMYLTSGIGHYIGFFYAVEGSAQPILSEVAFAVAHKLKSAIMSAASGWLGFGSKQRDDDRQKPKIEPETPLSLRYGLPDKRRQGDNIFLSPNNNYAATTDSFGRVTLIDVENGIAVRMWKGYRDAQLGWIQVREDNLHGNHDQELARVAQFLIFYAPRRGILEVWTAANGPRVAAFNVNKWCRLVCPSYGIMGLNNVTCRGVKTKVFQCALIEPTGIIKTLDIPFHLALSDKNSKRARDVHLLKKLKTVMKDTSEETESLENAVKNLLKDMKIASIKQQGMDRVLGAKYLSASCMQRILKTCLEQVTSKDEDTWDIDTKLFVRYCHLHDNLLKIYDEVNTINQTTAKTTSAADLTEELMQTFRLSESEAAHIITQLEQYDIQVGGKRTESRRVKFDVESKLSPASFISCFHCHLHCTDDQESSQQGSVTIATRLSDEKRSNLANFFFQSIQKETTCPSELSTILQESKLSPQLFMKLLVMFWLSDDNRKLTMTLNLHHAVKSLTSLIDKNTLIVEPGEVSSWWLNIREACHHSNFIQAAYILALVCRSVANEVIDSQLESKDPDADIESRDQVPVQPQGEPPQPTVVEDSEQWNTSVKKLEDVLCLSCLLHITQSEVKGQAVPDPIIVSVTKLMEGGRGAVSELVGCYVTQSSLHPSELFLPCHMSESTEFHGEAMEVTETTFQTFIERVQGQMEVLKQRLPHSMEVDVLLANCCWENVVQWNKDTKCMKNLESSLEFLRLIQNAILRQGVGSLLWHMFIAKTFSAAAHLMEKVGKVPKDRLCRKEVGLTEGSMAGFVGSVCDLLDIIMESCSTPDFGANCEANEVPVFNIEHLWQDVRGPASLVELAIDQKSTNYGLLRLHYQLAVMMHAMLVFGMKSVKVLSLFDSKGKSSLFLDLHQHPLLPSQNIDAFISNSRKNFFARVISNVVLSLDVTKHSQSSASSSASPTSPNKKFVEAATKWPALVLELAKDFGLDLDFFKRHHVCELYSGGHDRMAEEVLSTVNDHELMGSQLLLIAGHRTAYFLLDTHKSKGMDLLTTVSPALPTWLKSLDKGHLRQPKVSAEDVARLVQHVANNLPEGYPEYELAISLVDLVQSMSSLS